MIGLRNVRTPLLRYLRLKPQPDVGKNSIAPCKRSFRHQRHSADTRTPLRHADIGPRTLIRCWAAQSRLADQVVWEALCALVERPSAPRGKAAQHCDAEGRECQPDADHPARLVVGPRTLGGQEGGSGSECGRGCGRGCGREGGCGCGREGGREGGSLRGGRGGRALTCFKVRLVVAPGWEVDAFTSRRVSKLCMTCVSETSARRTDQEPRSASCESSQSDPSQRPPTDRVPCQSR